MKKEMRLTEDGSCTFYIADLQEGYHSTHGAIQEAKHVYIDAALIYAMASFESIHLLEVGFGTGLNALLSLLEADKQKINIFYYGIEAFPLNKKEISQINHPSLLQVDGKLFNILHQTYGKAEYVSIGRFFHLKNIHTTLQEAVLPENQFNVVFFDAFAPNVQPELWEKKVFEKIFNTMSHQGVLTTYSAKGAVRRTMQDVGFIVERIQGATGKREMLRAFKP